MEERRNELKGKHRIIVDVIKRLGNTGISQAQLEYELSMKSIQVGHSTMTKYLAELYGNGVLDRVRVGKHHGSYYEYYFKPEGERKPVLPEVAEPVVLKNESELHVVEPVQPTVEVLKNQELNYSLDRRRKFTITKAGVEITLTPDEATEVAKFLRILTED